MTIEQFKKKLFSTSPDSFEDMALWLFRYQVNLNAVYREFVTHLGIHPANVTNLSQIPFLPIELFKNHCIKTGNWQEEAVFTSSGTTGSNTSKHYIRHVDFYLQNTLEIFTRFYEHPQEYVILALLPSYLERSGSGLISMVNHFVSLSKCADSGFYLYNHSELAAKLAALKAQKKAVILFGVTFALLDFVDKHPATFPELLVFETGGMKGRKEEMTREEVHRVLKNGFGTTVIHSEYGMTELQSQAYSKGGGVFTCPPWMKVLVRESDDPLTLAPLGTRGGINIIDLANSDTCAFIATEDLGKKHSDDTFEVAGRIDYSDARGCNLMLV